MLNNVYMYVKHNHTLHIHALRHIIHAHKCMGMHKTKTIHNIDSYMSCIHYFQIYTWQYTISSYKKCVKYVLIVFNTSTVRFDQCDQPAPIVLSTTPWRFFLQIQKYDCANNWRAHSLLQGAWTTHTQEYMHLSHRFQSNWPFKMHSISVEMGECKVYIFTVFYITQSTQI